MLCFAASLLLSGCVSDKKEVSAKKDDTGGKKMKTPFPEVKTPVQKKKIEQVKKNKPTKKTAIVTPAPKKIPVKKKIVIPKALNRFLPRSEASPFLKPDSFVMCWQVSGPYPISSSVHKSQGPSIIHHEFVSKEKQLTCFAPIPGGRKWQSLPAPLKGPMGKVDLSKYWKAAKGPATAYAATSLFCPVGMKNLTLKTGSSGYIKIWINGKLVQTFNRSERAGKFDQDSSSGINLHRGMNYIVVKTLCFKAPWQFYLRFADAKGMPISVLPTIAR